jgi:thiol-disulfide isomerase/thioredoxin
VVKDFRGNDSTKSAIESSKKLKGTTRYLVINDRSIKILKSDGKVIINAFRKTCPLTPALHPSIQEVVAKHPVNVVCCIVRDKVDPPAFFGYITSDSASERKFSHVYSTGCMVRDEQSTNNGRMTNYKKSALHCTEVVE